MNNCRVMKEQHLYLSYHYSSTVVAVTQFEALVQNMIPVVEAGLVPAAKRSLASTLIDRSFTFQQDN